MGPATPEQVLQVCPDGNENCIICTKIANQRIADNQDMFGNPVGTQTPDRSSLRRLNSDELYNRQCELESDMNSLANQIAEVETLKAKLEQTKVELALVREESNDWRRTFLTVEDAQAWVDWVNRYGDMGKNMTALIKTTGSGKVSVLFIKYDFDYNELNTYQYKGWGDYVNIGTMQLDWDNS